MKKMNSAASAVVSLLVVGAVAVPTVVWLLCKASENKFLSEFLRNLR
jgi:hypothetical protein